MLAALILAALALPGCATVQPSGSPSPPGKVTSQPSGSPSPSSQGKVRYRCRIKYVPGDVLPSESQTYGVISLTVINQTGQPFDPTSYKVYVFKAPGVQDGAANVPESWKGDVAPGAREAFVGGNLWPLTDTCSLAAAYG